MRQLTSNHFLKNSFIFVLQLHSQINKSFSRSTKLSKVTDELQKRIVQPWTLEAAICSMNLIQEVELMARMEKQPLSLFMLEI